MASSASANSATASRKARPLPYVSDTSLTVQARDGVSGELLSLRCRPAIPSNALEPVAASSTALCVGRLASRSQSRGRTRRSGSASRGTGGVDFTTVGVGSDAEHGSLAGPLSSLLTTPNSTRSGSGSDEDAVMAATLLKLAHRDALAALRSDEAAREQRRSALLGGERVAWRRTQLRAEHDEERRALKAGYEALQARQELEMVGRLQVLGLLPRRLPAAPASEPREGARHGAGNRSR